MSIQKPLKKCIRCKHYYTTWDKNMPYGCKAYGFKSLKSPIEAIKTISGVDCLLFSPKTQKDKND